MDKKKHSQEFLRKRKMLLFLPLVVIPLLSMVFYGMGGGKASTNDAVATSGRNGLNMNLPGAKFNKQDSKMDKLSAYKKADLDSARLKDQLREDPYHTGSMPTSSNLPSITSLKGINPGKDEVNNKLQPISPQDTTANAILRRLDHLKQVLHQPDVNTAAKPFANNDMVAVPSMPGQPDTERLAQLLSRLKASNASTDSDPQLDKLNGMLDKILKIQHTGIAAPGDTLIHQNKIPVYELHKDTDRPITPDLVSGGLKEQSHGEGFFTLDEQDSNDSVLGNVIRALIEGDQTLVSGGTIALRLSEDAVINGTSLAKNNLLYGLVSLTGERMNVMINSLRYNNSIYPVALQVYDMDGLPGIRIPGAISREVAKESADQAVSGIGMTTLDPSIGAQAANAGIQAVKTLFSRKVKLVRVSIPSGYQVYLKNVKK